MQTARKPLKRCLASLVIREMQIKTTMKYHSTLIRMAIIKKTTNKSWRGCGEKGTFATLLTEMSVGAAITENHMEILQNIKTRIAI